MTTKERFRVVDVALNQYAILQVLDCWDCTVAFAITDDTYNRRVKDQRPFYCPNGHANYFTDTETKKLKRRAEQAELRLANAQESLRIERIEAEQAKRSAAAYKGHLTRMRRRIANGVCPCCTRSFTNVRRHMATQHPDVLAKLEAEPTR